MKDFHCCVCGSSICGDQWWHLTKEKPPRRICHKDYKLAQHHNIYLDEAGIEELIRNRDKLKVRDHPDTFCCIRGSEDTGKVQGWRWTNESIPRRIYEKDHGLARINEIYLDEAGVEKLIEKREKLKDRSHPDMFCCVCGSEESGGRTWRWTNESIPRRICTKDHGLAHNNGVYLDEAGVLQVENSRRAANLGLYRMGDNNKKCSVCNSQDHGSTGKNATWFWTEDLQRICKADWKLVVEHADLEFGFTTKGIKSLKDYLNSL